MIVIEAARAKRLPAASALGKRDLNRFLVKATEALGLAGDFSVLLTGDEHLRAMNLQFRGVDKPTDVLSFPALPEPANYGQGVTWPFLSTPPPSRRRTMGTLYRWKLRY